MGLELSRLRGIFGLQGSHQFSVSGRGGGSVIGLRRVEGLAFWGSHNSL